MDILFKYFLLGNCQEVSILARSSHQRYVMIGEEEEEEEVNSYI